MMPTGLKNDVTVLFGSGSQSASGSPQPRPLRSEDLAQDRPISPIVNRALANERLLKLLKYGMQGPLRTATIWLDEKDVLAAVCELPPGTPVDRFAEMAAPTNISMNGADKTLMKCIFRSVTIEGRRLVLKFSPDGAYPLNLDTAPDGSLPQVFMVIVSSDGDLCRLVNTGHNPGRTLRLPRQR